MVGLLMNVKKKPFDDIRVRRVLANLVPSDEILRHVFFNRALPLRGPIPSFVPGSLYSYWPYGGPESLRMSRATKLLDEAGLANGFSFTLSYDLGFPEYEAMATLVQAALAKAKITANLDPLPRGAFNERKTKGELQAFIDSSYPWHPEAAYLIDQSYGCRSFGASFIGYCNPNVTRLVDLAREERDGAKRDSLYKEAQRLIIDDAPWAWIATRNFNAAMRANIKGYIHMPDSRYRYYILRREP
jgi:peptide/nickel transport system substrate-binding protein